MTGLKGGGGGINQSDEVYLQRQTQRAEKQQEVTHKAQKVRGEGLGGRQPIGKLLQQTCRGRKAWIWNTGD